MFRNVLSVSVEDSWRFGAGQNWPKLANVTFHGNWEGAEWEGNKGGQTQMGATPIHKFPVRVLSGADNCADRVQMSMNGEQLNSKSNHR